MQPYTGRGEGDKSRDRIMHGTNWSEAEEPLYPATETFTENHVKIQHEEGVLQQHIEFGMNLLYAQ